MKNWKVELRDWTWVNGQRGLEALGELQRIAEMYNGGISAEQDLGAASGENGVI